MSAWGKSWGLAWGRAWGLVEAPVLEAAPPSSTYGGRGRKSEEDDAELAHIRQAWDDLDAMRLAREHADAIAAREAIEAARKSSAQVASGTVRDGQGAASLTDFTRGQGRSGTVRDGEGRPSGKVETAQTGTITDEEAFMLLLMEIA